MVLLGNVLNKVGSSTQALRSATNFNLKLPSLCVAPAEHFEYLGVAEPYHQGTQLALVDHDSAG